MIGVSVNKQSLDFYSIMNGGVSPWLQLKLPFIIPHQLIKAEIERVLDYFVEHRSYGEDNQGWSSLILHGLGPEKSSSHTAYGYSTADMAPYDWQAVTEQMPVTKDFFKNHFGYESYHRLRVMKLNPGGKITLHRDDDVSRLGPLNIAIHQPENCTLTFEGHGHVPYKNGSAFLLDLSIPHEGVNHSNENRYHIIVHGRRGPLWKKWIEESFLESHA